MSYVSIEQGLVRSIQVYYSNKDCTETVFNNFHQVNAHLTVTADSLYYFHLDYQLLTNALSTSPTITK